MVLGSLERGRTSATGAARPQEFLQAARLRHRRRTPRAADGARRRAGHRRPRRQVHATTFSSTASAAPTTPPARPARRSTSWPFTPRATPRYVDGHVRMGIATQLQTIDDGFARIAAIPGDEEQAHRHRRIGPRRLRRLPGPAARLSQRHHVFELHGRQLRPQARPRRQARRQPRRRADLGVRIRGPALFRRLPLAGHQRHRQARAERVSHVQPDERPAASKATSSGAVSLDDHPAARRARQARRRRLRQLRWPQARTSWCGTTTTTTYRVPTPVSS